jgi:hypothetical protein
MGYLIKRDIEKEVVKWLGSKQIIAIRGTRQCGKTTFLKRLVEVLIGRDVDMKRIHFLSFEDDIEKEKFESNPKDYIQYFLGSSAKKHFFLLDEVQYIKNAGKLLKLVYDGFENIKIIVTGSSTLDLNEIGSYLVGRVLLFEMYPFSFLEFLRAKDEKLARYYSSKKINFKKPVIKKEKLVFLEELNKYLIEYITYGGYPEIVLEKNFENKKILLKNLFLTYIEKDVVKVYGSKYKQRVSDLIKHLASINAGIVNYNELSGLTGLYDKEVKEILRILEETYIIKLLRPFHRNLTTELRKNPKAYFIDTGLRNFMVGRFEFNDEEKGKLLENYVLGKFREEKINFWRTTAKAEVDFIITEKTPIEVKAYPKITRSFRSFITAYRPKIAFLLNLSVYKKIEIGKTAVYLVPLGLV